MENGKIKNGKTPIGKRILKIAVFSVILCLVMCLVLVLYVKLVPQKIAELEEKGKMDNTIWLIRYSSLVPPLIIVAVLLTLFYRIGDAYRPIETQRDKTVIILIVLLFTYLVMLPSVNARSIGWQTPPLEGEEDVKSLIELTIGWFGAQIVPFLLVLGYHLIRASSEKKELYENEE